jgi:hypothetical protein
MKRTTVFLDAALENDLKALARRRGQPMAALVREGLTAYVARQAAEEPAPRLSFLGIGRSGRRDVAQRHEELLWRGLTPHGEPRPTKARRRAKPKPARKRRA